MIDLQQSKLEIRSNDLKEAFGFGLPPVLLPYAPVSAGDWAIRYRMGGVGSSYIARSCVEPNFHILQNLGTTWMSTSLFELESHAFHLQSAGGLVVTAGLGMGMFAAAAAAKSEVDRVIVVEIDETIIDLVGHRLIPQRPELAKKIQVVRGDALDVEFMKALAARTGRPDQLVNDIYVSVPHEDAPVDTARMVEALDPVAAGWWGQELEIALFAQVNEIPLDMRCLELFSAEYRIPFSPSEGYVAFCQDVADTHDIELTAESGMRL